MTTHHAPGQVVGVGGDICVPKSIPCTLCVCVCVEGGREVGGKILQHTVPGCLVGHGVRTFVIPNEGLIN